MSGEQGPQVEDKENAYRVILCIDHWVTAEGRPSSAAFTNPCFSVDIESKTTPEDSWDRHGEKTLNLVSFNCGEARILDYDTRDERDEKFSENLAHAHVCMLSYSELSAGKRKIKARKLVSICKTIIVNRPRKA